MSVRALTDAKVCRPVPAHGLDTGMNDLDGLPLDRTERLENENVDLFQLTVWIQAWTTVRIGTEWNRT